MKNAEFFTSCNTCFNCYVKNVSTDKIVAIKMAIKLKCPRRYRHFKPHNLSKISDKTCTSINVLLLYWTFFNKPVCKNNLMFTKIHMNLLINVSGCFLSVESDVIHVNSLWCRYNKHTVGANTCNESKTLFIASYFYEQKAWYDWEVLQ